MSSRTKLARAALARYDIPVEKIATTPERLERLLAEVLERGLQEPYRSLRRRAQLPPDIRLVVNLKELMRQMLRDRVSVVVPDGLAPGSLDTLRAVDSSDISMDSRRTAHSLYDMEARASFITYFDGLFRDMRSRKRHHLVQKPLDLL